MAEHSIRRGAEDEALVARNGFADCLDATRAAGLPMVSSDAALGGGEHAITRWLGEYAHRSLALARDRDRDRAPTVDRGLCSLGALYVDVLSPERARPLLERDFAKARGGSRG